MAIVPAGFVNQAHLAREVSKAVRKLPKDVHHVAFSLGEDSTGDPALFFRVVLSDQASREDRLAEVTRRIRSRLEEELRPRENWGLLPYFRFRSQSEQMELGDASWT